MHRNGGDVGAIFWPVTPFKYAISHDNGYNTSFIFNWEEWDKL